MKKSDQQTKTWRIFLLNYNANTGEDAKPKRVRRMKRIRRFFKRLFRCTAGFAGRKYDSSQCAYLNRRSFSSFRSGDLVILTFLSTGTSDSRRSERYQPFNCISWMVLFTKSASKWPKLPTGTRLFLWNRDRKRCLHIPHIHLPLVNVTTFFFSVFTVTPKMLKVLYSVLFVFIKLFQSLSLRW